MALGVGITIFAVVAGLGCVAVGALLKTAKKRGIFSCSRSPDSMLDGILDGKPNIKQQKGCCSSPFQDSLENKRGGKTEEIDFSKILTNN